jgi:hypothetical protein
VSVTVRALVAPGPLPPARALEIAAGIAQALIARGAVHGGLTSELVVVEHRGGRVEWVRVLDSPSLRPSCGAPEQVAGGEADARTDVYAIGALLHEMVRGAPPSGDVAAALSHAPPEVASLVLRCLAPRAADRPRDPEALARELAALRPRGAPAPRANEARPPVRPWFLVVAGLALIVGLAIAFRGRERRGDGEIAISPETLDRLLQAATRAEVVPYRASDPFDLRVDPPPGIALVETEPGIALGAGTVDSLEVWTATTALPVDGESLTLALLSDGAEEIPREQRGHLVEKRTRAIRGERHVSVIHDDAERRMRVETVIYPRATALYTVSFRTTAADFDRTVALRDDLFTLGVTFTRP